MKKIILIALLFIAFNSYAQFDKGGAIALSGVSVFQLDTSARNIIKIIEDERGTPFNSYERFYVNYIVTNLKSTGVWYKCKAIYGMVGGTASAHKWNWKDMRDLDAAYRLTYSGTITHSNLNGMKGDGITGWADTKLKLESNISTTGFVSFGFFTNSSTAGALDFDIGAGNNFGLSSYSYIASRPSNQFFGSSYIGAPYTSVINTPFVKGLYQFTQNGNSESFINGLKINGSLSTTTNYIVNVNYALMALNESSSIQNFSAKTHGFDFFSSPLTDAESNKLFQIINFSQTMRANF